MVLGFIGTRRGLTAAQREAVRRLLEQIRPEVIHHGNGTGADEQCSLLILESPELPVPREVAHPCDRPGRQSRSTFPDEVRPPRPPLERGAALVGECQLLLACPAAEEQEGEGCTVIGTVWATVRQARRAGLPRVIVYPDGRVVSEGE